MAVVEATSKRAAPAIKIGPTQVKLDTRLLGDRWKVTLEEILLVIAPRLRNLFRSVSEKSRCSEWPSSKMVGILY